MHTKITGTVITTSNDVLTRTNFQALFVKLFQTTVNEEKELAATEVKEDGSFDTTLEVPTSTMLTARLYLKPDGKRMKQVAETEPHCPKENIILQFEYDELKNGQPLFTALKERIVPLLGKLRLKDIDKEQQRKLECIAGASSLALARLINTERLMDELKTGLQKKSGAKTSAAKRNYTAQADDTQLPASAEAVLFVLMKNDYQAGLAKVLATSPKQVEAKLQQAIKANEMAPLPNQSATTEMLLGVRDVLMFNSNDDENSYDAKLIHISSAGSAVKTDLLNKAIDAGSLKNLLAASAPAKEPAKKQPTAVAKKSKASVAASSAKPAVSPALVQELQAIAELDEQLKKFPPLLDVTVNTIRTKAGEIDLQKLAGKTESDWLGLIKKIPATKQFPKSYPDNKESVKLYARDIAASFTKKFPALTVLSNLSTSKIARKSTFVSILKKNPDFDITKQSVNTWFKVTNKPTAANEISAANLKELQKLQRCIKLTDGLHNMKHTEALLQGGMESSHHITRMGKYEFTQTMKKQKLTEAESTVIYNRAKHITNTVKMLAVNYLRYENKESLMPQYLNFGQLAADDALGLPDMESIFGSLNSCSCSECQSVYSAAAYLTDLLHWLKSDIVCKSSGVNGYAALSGTLAEPRRKDISYILLNCKNTNELLPYIDLVNEILSINLLKSPDYSILQTTKSSKHLIAEPEHRFPEAEEKLTTAFFPFTLPYDAAYDSAVNYMEKIGIAPHAFVHAFTPASDKYNSALWSQVYFKFNDAEFSLISNSHSGETDFWKKYWGETTAPINVGTVLKSTGLSLAELRDYLGSFYICQSDEPIKVIPPEEDDCNIDKYTLSPALNIAIADRFMRFMRLRKKTGLTVWELDTAIRTLGGDITEKFLIQLAGAIAFVDKYRIPFAELMLWLGDNSYRPSFPALKPASVYYEEKYMNERYPDDIKIFFNPVPGTGNAFSTPVASLTPADKQRLCTVYDIATDEADFIIAYGQFGATNTLDFTHLAFFERYISFCKTLGISISEFPKVFELLTVAMQNSLANMQGIWQFEEAWNELKKLGRSPLYVLELMQGTGKYELASTGEATSAVLAEEAQACFEKLQEALTRAKKSNPGAFSNTTGLAADSPVAAYYDLFNDTFINQLSLMFGLDKGLVKEVIKDVIHNYDSGWIDENIGSEEENTDWANKEIIFTPLYRVLLRVSLVSEICGLTNEGLAAGVQSEIKNNLQLPFKWFYWLRNDFTYIGIGSSLISLKNIAEQAASLGISQDTYLGFISNIYTYSINENAYYTTPPVIIVNDIYNASVANSALKKYSAFQFTEIYKIAQGLSGKPQQLQIVINTCIELMNIAAAAGAPFDEVAAWVYQSTGLSSNIAAFKRILRSRYATEEAWYKFITPIHNGLRMRLRDALVAYYIGQLDFKNSNAIYAHFLLDSEMEPCMKTSRIVQAISSVQLLIHRGLMGLEQQMCMDEDDKKEWEWRKNYRVWEANRKIFIYPENWIEPSLRLDKTPFFKELEDILAQDEINTANAEKAFSSYLCNLNNVARLDIRGTYVEDFTDAGNTEMEVFMSPVIHVFARTWNAPFIYYYRKLEKNIWTAWEKLELDIEGDHLIPIMFNRRLYLFWPLFIEKEHRYIKWGDQNASYYEIKMCYSKLEFGKWTSKKILDGTMFSGSVSGPGVFNNLYRKLNAETAKNWSTRPNLVMDNDSFEDFSNVKTDKDSFFFWAQKQDSGDLIIHCRREYSDFRGWGLIGYTDFAYEDSFLISACDEKVEIIAPVIMETDINARRLILRPWLTKPKGMQMVNGLDTNDVILPNEEGMYLRVSLTAFIDKSFRVFKKTPSSYTLTYPHQAKDAMGYLPFFYCDKKHTFIIGMFYGLQSYEHPYSCLLLSEFNRKGIDGILNSKHPDINRQTKSVAYFKSDYDPDSYIWPHLYPVNDYDFTLTGTYSIYNWEIFFHTVSLIARQLRQNNKFAETIRWLQFVFDPTNRDTEYGNLRYWKIKPFMKDVTEGSIQKLMQMLSGTDPAEEEKRKELRQQIAEWRDNPFDPHKIGSMRNRAYMLWTAMEYMETLTDWADSLFRQFTMESVNEAINLYVLASEILGKRPQKIEKAQSTDISFNEIENNLDAFSNTAVAIETIMGHDDHMPLNGPAYGLPELVFCIPENPKLKGLWDRVEDRLFKIRHCMNIEGKKVELALFQPPIDPALLVRAKAMGMDLADVLSDLAAPPPHYRFSFLLQKATDFCNEVKSLGGQLLSALEKKDSEELSQIRQVHEQNILKAARNIKKIQIDDAKNSYTSLQHSKKLIEIRLNDYSSREFISSKEEKTISLTKKAEGFMYVEQGANLVSAVLNIIPDAHVGFPSNFVKIIGGDKLAYATRVVGSAAGVVSSVFRNMASMSSTYAGYDRRQEEWNLQIKTATEELNQMEKQLLGAEIRIAITEKELDNHDLQVEQSKEMYDHLKGKFSNLQLYTWMSGELMKLYRQSYELAYDMAKQAQQAYYKELGVTGDSIINFGHWDSGRKGLLAGEKLSLQLKQLDAAYIKNNIREYEITKHISLSLLDPIALINLRNTGKCDFEIPEVLYDLDYPGHYFRRIKSASISMPCIAGPFTSVNTKLTLEKHEIKRNVNDTVNERILGYSESIVTSSAQNDSGVFELNFRDERYVPFEGTGAISNWSLELTAAHKQFDYNTIADVVMHIKYTAREGGEDFRGTVSSEVNYKLDTIKQSFSETETGLHIAINMKHDMPNEWHLLKQKGKVDLKIDKLRLPYMAQILGASIDNIIFITKGKGTPVISLFLNQALALSLENILDSDLYSGSIPSINHNLNTSYDLALSVSDPSLPITEAPWDNLEELIMVIKYNFS